MKNTHMTWLLVCGTAAIMVATPAYANEYSARKAYDSNYSPASNNRNDNAIHDRNISERDPRFMSNTVSDCVHGSTGVSANIDCSRGRANRNSNDTNAYNTDTGELNGSRLVRSNSQAVDPKDGMTAVSERD